MNPCEIDPRPEVDLRTRYFASRTISISTATCFESDIMPSAARAPPAAAEYLDHQI
jgi:hypothetical protein